MILLTLYQHSDADDSYVEQSAYHTMLYHFLSVDVTLHLTMESHQLAFVQSNQAQFGCWTKMIIQIHMTSETKQTSANCHKSNQIP